MIKKLTLKMTQHRIWRYAIVSVTNYYYFSWLLLIASTFGMIGISHATTIPPMVASLVLCIASATVSGRLTPRVLKILRIVGYIFSLLIAGWAIFGNRQSKDIANVVMEIMLAILPALLQDMKNQRRIFAAIAVTNLLAIGAILLADNLNAYGIFLIFIVTMGTVLNATRMYFISANAADSGDRLTLTFFYQLLRTVPLGLAFGAIIFYWFPRVSEMSVDFNISGMKSRTGYNSEISLNSKGSIEESDRINLWITSKDTEWLANQSELIYLRGTTLNSFDGLTWRNSGTLSQLASQTPDFRVNKAHLRERRELTFFREPSSSRDVIHPYGLWNLEVPGRVSQGIFVDSNGNIIFTRDGSPRYQYDIIFSPRLPSAIEGMDSSLGKYLDSIKILRPNANRFFELSAADAILMRHIPNKISGEVWFRNFNEKISSSLDGPINSVPVAAILHNTQRFFRQNYTANLRANQNGENNLRDFLTTQNQGHCELFASAAALYLRDLGIPTRLVTGYFGGHFNFVSHMLEIPEKNAHVWLEIFNPGIGWLPFDPTPLIVQTESNSSFDSGAAIIVNALRFWFTRYVIDYDARGQKELVTTVSRIDMSRLLDFQNISFDRDTGELIVFGIMVALTLWLLFKVLTRDDRLPDAPAYYRSVAARLMASGHEKNKSETYLEFHKRILEAGINPDLVYAAHFALERDLYTSKTLSRAEQRILRKALRKMPIKKKIKNAEKTGPLPQKALG